MTEDEVQVLNAARRRLTTQQIALARSIAKADVVSMTEVADLTQVLAAIEHLDRALLDAGRPHMQGDFDGIP